MSNMASEAKACFSSKVEYRAVIRYLYLKGKTGKEIHAELANVYGSSAPSYAQVKFWVGEFKRGRTSLEDEARSVSPLDASDKGMCKKVWDLVYSDRLILVEETAQALGISHGRVSTILHDRLGMRKLTAHWVPKSLSDEQMATRVSVCSALLKRFRSKDDFLLHLVTVDETWVHYYEPENKAQSRQWVGSWSLRPKNFQDPTICWQDDGTVFWDAKGVIMLDFLPKRSTITGVYYANLLDQLRTAIHEKRRGKLSKGVLLQQDNARVHTCKVAMDAVERNGYELIPHPAYLPDLAPSDFFLFPNLKKDIHGLHFRSDEEVVPAVEEWVNGKDPDFSSSGLMALEHSWSKCITLEGNYIEKEEVDLNRKKVRLDTYRLTLVPQFIYKCLIKV